MDFTHDEILAKAPDLMPYLPEYYQNSDVVKNVMYSESYEIGKVYVTLEDIEKQLYIDSATWGLSIFEKIYNITPKADSTFEERREVIKAKKRGRGTTTKAMIKNTAEAFSGGEVDITEHPENYYFTVKFVGAKGIPQNMSGFLNMLNEIKPAHLNYEIEYSFTVWNFIQSQLMTWDTAKAKTWDEIKTY